MTSFNQFDYHEVLTGRNLANLPDLLRFDRDIKEEGKIIRLLTGSVYIFNNISGKKFRQCINYSKLGFPRNSRISNALFLEFLDSSANISDLENYLRNSEARNIPYFKELLLEFTCYFLAKKEKKYTIAFLHLYRLLEFFSYTFPMLYASRAKGYIGTWKKLQSYFKGSDSELKFLNLFIDEFFTDYLKDYPVTFSITAFNEDIRKNYYTIINQICTQQKPIIEVLSDNPFSEIIIRNKDIPNFAITLRNRYFHFLTGGQSNIPSSLLQEPDDFFEFIIESLANWLAVTYFEMIKYAIVN
ncbi:MAG: hypothetical protein GY795_17045 [Desulfobacterales bacterium]|nr:hypothetical protein [Desulfobacterales bacterium]